MNKWLTYKDYMMSVEVVTVPKWRTEYEIKRCFVATNGNHRITIPIKWRHFNELYDIACKKIDKHLRESY